MKGIYLLLGTNLGDREKNLSAARNLMKEEAIELKAVSSIYETAAWGIEQQPGFLNQVLEVATDLSPEALLKTLLAIELEMGRVRIQKWGERLIDIDILYYQDKVVDTADLKVPHPEIPNRRFTLVPLVELAAGEVHPVLGKTQQELLAVCPDGLEVRLV
ncbi:MAG: 2-amino-4-hydroxy-6-hydroxymethyldihydropteridine diphosphokinase [Roseivirga sp.]